MTFIRPALLAVAAIAAIASPAAAQVLTRAYVANRGAASVTVVDITTAGVLKTIALEAAPYDVLVADDRVFVSMPAANRIAVIDPVTLNVIDSIAVAGAPRDLDRRNQTAIESRIYISTDDGLRTYDRATGALSAAVAVGPGSARVLEAGNANFTATQGQVFVAACDGGAAVRIVTETSGSVSAPVATGNAPCAALLTGSAFYVANTADHTVTVFTPGLQSPMTIAVAAQPIGFAETTAGIRVASASGTLTLLDRTTHGVITTRAIGGSPSALAGTFLPGGTGEALLVADSSGTLRVLSSTGDLLRTAPTGPSPGAVDLGKANPDDPVTLSTEGLWNDQPVREPAMSRDGRFVAFSSAATNLVAGDTNAMPDVFVRDRLLRRTTRVSVSSSGGQAEHGGNFANVRWGSYLPALSATGRYVLFLSLATTLVDGDANGREDVFLHDRDVDADGLFDEPGQISTRRVSVMSDGTDGLCRIPLPAACNTPHIEATLSGDGRQVAFSTNLELDQGDVNGLSDVYVHDVGRGLTTRLSLRPGGAPGAGVATGPVLNTTGRIVAFRTSDPGVVSYDTNGVDDVFATDRDPDANGVFDEQAPSFTHVSLRPGGALYAVASSPLAISDDGRWIAYTSYPTLGIFDRSTGHNGLVRDLSQPIIGAGQFSPDARYLAHVAFGTGPMFVRTDRDADGDGVFDEAGDVDIGQPVSIRWDAREPATDAALRAIVYFADGWTNGLAVQDLLGPAPPPFDTDADGLANAFETRFGLAAASDAGADGASGDPDGDGVSNLDEQLAGTHPRGFQTRYFAEGATGAFFSTRIAVANPGSAPSTVLVRYQTDTGHTTSTWVSVPGRARRFVNVGDVPSLGNASFSTIVEADEPVIVDRSMFWGTVIYGSHAETSLASPSTTWFLAEGATHGAFDLFYLLQNPSPTATASVEVRFLMPTGPPVVRTYAVPPSRRLTIYVDQVSGLESTDISAAVTSLNAVPIIVERAMYYSRPGTTFAAGHGSAAVPSPSTQWFLAEGATGSYFDLFVLLANPSATAADVRLTYLRPSDAPIVRTRTLAPNSRATIFVELEDPALVDTAVSTIVESLNGVGIVAERSMWWPATGGWQEAHNSPGATSPALRWGFADGEVGPPPYNTQTYFLIANTSAVSASVQVTLLFDDGAPVAKTFSVPANSRFNVPVASEFPAAVGRGFGALIESVGAPAPIVVERAMYSDAGGTVWSAGTNAVGTRLP
jgi:YVTN family beta-propeller protein